MGPAALRRSCPALALWYAYSAAAQHAKAQERNQWLVKLGGLLAQHGQGTATLDDSAEAIRQIVGAPEMLDPPARHRITGELRPERILASTWAESRARGHSTATSSPTAGRPAS